MKDSIKIVKEGKPSFFYLPLCLFNFIYRKLFLVLLGDRSSYSYFPFNRWSANRRAQVTSRASRGKSIVPIVFFQETNIHFIIYGGRHIIRWRNAFFPQVITMGDVMDSTVMHINKGNAHGTEGNAPTRLNFQQSILLKLL